MSDPDRQKPAFNKITEEYSDTEKIFLPESVQKELLEESGTGPLGSVIAKLREAQVPDETINKYRNAVIDFLQERGSKAEITEYTAMSPQTHYFSPYVEFSGAVPPIPELTHESIYKPHLGKEGKCTIAEEPVHGADVLRNVKFASPRNQPKPQQEPRKVSPLEKILVQMNQYTYALHEPIHITQAFAKGDKWQYIKDRNPDLANVIDPEKEKTYIENAPTALANVPTFELEPWMRESPFIIAQDPLGVPLTEEKGNIGPMRMIIANNEATMDGMADEACGPLIKNHPEFVLWTHNIMTQTIEGLRELRHILADTEEISDIELIQHGIAYERLANSLDFMERYYFAEFPSSENATQFLTEIEHEVLGRKLSGTVAFVQTPFDRLEMLNTMTDIQKLLDARDPKKKTTGALELYIFPSGKKFFKNNEGKEETPVHPMTDAGAQFGAAVFEKMVLRKWDSAHIQKEFSDLQYALSEDNATDIAAIQKRWGEELVVELSDNDMREMFGVSEYLFFNRLETPSRRYSYNETLRKYMIERLRASDPEAVRELTRMMFFELPLNRAQTILLTEFGSERFVPDNPEASFSSGHTEWILHHWGHIANQDQLGIVNLDMTKITDAEREELKSMYDALSRDDFRDGEYIIRRMGEIKIRQLNRQTP